MHRVEDVLRLAKLLGIAPVAERGRARRRGERDRRPDAPYAVIHAAPMFRYKRWHARGLARARRRISPSRGLAIVATGGPARCRARAISTTLWRGIDVRRLDGTLTWPELATLLAGARVYRRPGYLGDPSCGRQPAARRSRCYGPTDPRLWGPWPVGGLAQPWAASRRDPAARQCLAGAEPAALHALPAGGLSPAPAKATAGALMSCGAARAARRRSGALRHAARAGWRSRLKPVLRQ